MPFTIGKAFILFFLWCLYAGPVLIAMTIERRSNQANQAYSVIHYGFTVLPFIMWGIFTSSVTNPKGIANLIELPLLGLGTGVLFLVGQIFRNSKRKSAVVIALLLSCALAVLMGLFFPALPE